MSNEILFIGFALFLLSLNLIAFRLGRTFVFALIAIYTILMNIFVLKQFELFGILVTGGNALYGAIFLLTDILSEHHGKKEAFRAVLIGFLASLIFVITLQVLLLFTPSSEDFAQDSLQTLFTITPRILLGSMLAYIVAQSLDVWLYGKIKKWTQEKYLWIRNNGSTLVSQFVDTLIFTAVGLTSFSFLPFDGVINPSLFWPVFWATYALKVLVAMIDTPFIYLSRFFRPKNNYHSEQNTVDSKE